MPGDVFDQIHADAQPSAGDVFAQIHAEANPQIVRYMAPGQGVQDFARGSTAEQAFLQRFPNAQQIPIPSGAGGRTAPSYSAPVVTDFRPLAQAQAEDTAGFKQAVRRVVPAMGATAGSMVLPALAPEAGLTLSALLTGAGAGLGTSAGQAVTGQNPVSLPNLKEAGTNAALAGGTDLLFGAIPALTQSKLGRSFINESLGATARDVTYGNPARGLGDISTPFTGDVEKMKAALRSGASMADAEVAAGGRLGAVSQKIQSLAPQLQSMVNASSKTVPVADAIDKPLMDSVQQIIDNPAVGISDKGAMLTQLGELQQSLKQGLGSDLSMADALRIKRAVGAEAGNWIQPPRNEIQEAYRDVYGSLKNAIHSNVPGSADIDEQLTDAVAAQNSLQRLARGEEVSRGAGPFKGSFGTNWLGRLESIIGRVLPATANASGTVRPIAAPVAAAQPGTSAPVITMPLSRILEPLAADNER